MPVDRFLHPRAGRSRKITLLTDLEYRVWTQYLLSADDFGVMRGTSLVLQNDNLHLANRPAKLVKRCLDVLVKSGLIKQFEHQGQPYVFQSDWQLWQKVEYPRATVNPQPSGADLEACEDSTRALFAKHPGGQRKDRRRADDVPSDSGRASQIVQDVHPESIPPTRARARETAKANGYRLTANGSEERLDVAFQSFREAYPEGRRKGGHLTEQAYLAEVHKAGGAALLVEALENHKKSGQWQNPQLVPGMDTWLTEERWRQRLDPPITTPEKTSRYGNWQPRTP